MKFYTHRKFAFQAIAAILALMLIDTFITSELSTRKALEIAFGENYGIFEGSIAVIIVFLSIIFFAVNSSKWLRIVLLAYNSILTFALVSDVGALMRVLPERTEGYAILFDAFLIWITNLIIFALWYWLLDGGGFEKRSNSDKKPHYDLVFPQEQHDIPGWLNWQPNFIDYLFLSFYSSMAFSPTDTLVLSRKMKFLLMLQAAISVVVLAMIGARAINLLG